MLRTRWSWIFVGSLVAVTAGAAPEHPVTVNADREQLGTVIEAIARQSGVHYHLEDLLREVPISLHLDRVSGDDAIRAAVSAASQPYNQVVLERKDNSYQIHVAPGATPPSTQVPGVAPVARSISVQFKDCPLREAVALLQRAPSSAPGIKIPSCRVEAAVQDRRISLVMTHDSDAVVLRLMVRQLQIFDRGAELVVKDTGMLVTTGPTPAVIDSRTSLADLTAPPLPNPPVRRIVLGLRNVSIEQALQALSNRTFPSFRKSLALSVADAVPDVRIKIDSVETDPEVSLQDVEAAIRAQVPAVRFQRQGSLLKVLWQPI